MLITGDEDSIRNADFCTLKSSSEIAARANAEIYSKYSNAVADVKYGFFLERGYDTTSSPSSTTSLTRTAFGTVLIDNAKVLLTAIQDYLEATKGFYRMKLMNEDTEGWFPFPTNPNLMVRVYSLTLRNAATNSMTYGRDMPYGMMICFLAVLFND